MRVLRILIAAEIIFALGIKPGNGQGINTEQDKFTFSGYVKNLSTVLTNKNFGDPLYDNLIHNRLEFSAYPVDNISFTLEGRNRALYGDRVKLFSDLGRDYSNLMNAQDGLVDLSNTWVSEEYWVLHSEIDRLYVDWSPGNWDIRLGRQRINWGKNLVWNPNDLFNTYSFYDFDYKERPGADALRVTYYRNFSSQIELAFAPEENMEESVGALYYSFHKGNYDIQLLGGYFKEEIVGGLGWSGYIGGASFRGEVNYYHPTKANDNKGYLLGAISTEYTFRNSLRLHFEGLYNGNDDRANIYQLMNTQGLEANNLSMFKYGVFGQVSYPLHPLVSTSLGSIYYPNQSLAFLMPSISYSIEDNWELYALAQIFMGKTENLLPESLRGSQITSMNQFNLLGLRLKWAF